MTALAGNNTDGKGALRDRYLVFTAFMSGAAIMVLELIGSRVIGPPFGVSLFVWTSLITVTLVSLALGYWIGGRVADRRNSHAALFSIIFIAGVFVLLIPLGKTFVIEQSLSLGLRAGSLVSSTVLFGPPLFFLGMVTPFTVKLYMAAGHSEVGKTVGWLYAVSTCGSFLGTVLTGFVLIPNLGVNNIIYLSSMVLLSLTAAYWALFRGKAYFAAIALLPAVLLLLPKDLPSVTRPDGTRVDLLMNADSAYGQIKVVDYSYGDSHLREFLLENMIQGAIDVNSGLSVSKYTYYIEQLARAYKGDAQRALVIGLGSGIIPGRFNNYGIKTDSVEINKAVVETASRFFSYDTAKNPTYVEDGRYFLKSSAEPYDIIVLDAFSGDTPPSHLVSLESFELMKKRLSTGGVLLINFVGGNHEEDRVVPSSLYGTLKKIFQHVDVYAGSEYSSGDSRVVNLIFAAYETERPLDETAIKDVYPPFEEDVRTLLGKKIPFSAGSILFTDNYNPIDFYDRKTRERFRTSVINSSDRGIVID